MAGVATPAIAADLRNATALLDAAGWPRHNQYVYLSDEVFGVSSLPSLAEPSVQELITYEGKKADLVKQIAPGVQNVATGQGFFFVAAQNISEVQPGGRLENVDLFIPYCCEDPAARALHLML